MHYGNEQANTVQNESELKDDLQNAIDFGELELHYQPKVDSRTNEIVGMEALLRWRHPELGIIAPDKFVPEAEKSGQIIEIGKWVIRTACAQNKEWLDRGFRIVPVAANISIRQFSGEDLTEYIGAILKRMNLPAKYLEIEISESIAMGMQSGAVETLIKLKRLGIGIAIDDFGPAYSLMNNIGQLPVDTVKLDKRIIDGINKNPQGKEITKTVLMLIRQMGLKTVAEGVEKKRQVEYLASEGCYIIQGFYYYKPMPALDLEKLLKVRKRQYSRVEVNANGGYVAAAMETYVSHYLDNFDIRHSYRGYQYLVNAICLGYENPQLFFKMTELYCKIAENNGITARSVERDIRYAIVKSNMTNKEFITKAVDTFRYADDIEVKSEHSGLNGLYLQ